MDMDTNITAKNNCTLTILTKEATMSHKGDKRFLDKN